MQYPPALILTSLSLLLTGCRGATPPVVTPPEEAADAPLPGRGGRAFDKWTADPEAAPFTPDDKGTPATADGHGGPFGDGTLTLAGAPMLNDRGHDYRLKNLYGWDLRGRDGVYGPAYQNKPYVLARNWLAGDQSVEQIAAILRDGDAEQPAFGDVLPAAVLEEIARFIVDVRDGALPRPDQIFALSEGTPGNYRLLAGADPARGAAIFAERCADCHGDDGTELMFDDGAYTLGSHARQKAYEDWFKILNGQPGTDMGRQVRGASGAEMAAEMLDVLAALCDRTRFPAGAATEPEVADGDPRCGSYLR